MYLSFFLLTSINDWPNSYGLFFTQVSGYEEQISEKDADIDYYSLHSGAAYIEEDGELSWFNAGVKVGVGISVGVCLALELVLVCWSALTKLRGETSKDDFCNPVFYFLSWNILFFRCHSEDMLSFYWIFLRSLFMQWGVEFQSGQKASYWFISWWFERVQVFVYATIFTDMNNFDQINLVLEIFSLY